MADVKISQLPQAALPLAGSEVFPLVQNGVTVQAPVRSVGSVATISDLRNITPVVGVVNDVEGYYSIGDGGGGQFYAVSGAATGTYVDNGGTIIVPTGTDGSSAWLRVIDGPISVKAFGARGDGVTDDAARIQAAINNFSGIIAFPLGVYIVNSTLTLNVWTYLQGQQGGFVYGPTASRVTLRFSNLATCMDTVGRPYIRIENITIDGNNSCQYGFVGGFVISMRSVNIIRCTEAGLYLPNSPYIPQTSVYEHCSFNGNKYGLYALGGGTQNFYSCVFRQNTADGVNGALLTSNFHDCVFESNVGYGVVLTGNCGMTSFTGTSYFEQNNFALGTNGYQTYIASTSDFPISFISTVFGSTTTTKVADIASGVVWFKNCSQTGSLLQNVLAIAPSADVVCDNSFANYPLAANAKIVPQVQTLPSSGIIMGGSGNYISIASYATAFGTADFTVSAVFMPNNTATNQRAIIGGAIGAFGMNLSGSTAGTYSINLQVVGTASYRTVSPVNIVSGSPVHICYVRASGVGSMYVNGVLVESFADTTNFTGNQQFIGYNGATLGLQGTLYAFSWTTAAITAQNVFDVWRAGGDFGAAGLSPIANMQTNTRPSGRVYFKGSSTSTWITMNGTANWGQPTSDFTTATTVGAAGAASALPANPVGYEIFYIGGTAYKRPYYNV
jgi:hypothetical protein